VVSEALPEWLSNVPEGAQMLVRVTPRSGTNSIAGPRGGRLLLRVTAAPEDGKANAAACKLVAKALRVGKTGVIVASGETARDKVLIVEGASAQEIADVLAS
jgi:uncharacterized protein YggU (UPF0235/DUF167 family)